MTVLEIRGRESRQACSSASGRAGTAGAIGGRSVPEQESARRECLTYIPEMTAELLHAVELAHLPRRYARPRLAEAFDVRMSETVHDLHHRLQVVLAVAFLSGFTEIVSLPAHEGEGSLSRKRTKARRMNLARTRTRSSLEAVSRTCTYTYQL